MSPPYKGGYQATLEHVAPDGKNVVFNSLGVIPPLPWAPAGVAYDAQRTASGWTTSAVELMEGEPLDFSKSLEYAMASRMLKEAPNEFELEVFLHAVGEPDINEDWTAFGNIVFTPGGIGKIAQYEGASAELCHLIINAEDPNVEIGGVKVTLPWETKGVHGDASELQLYNLSRGCGGQAPSVSMVGVNNLGVSINWECADDLGIRRYYSRNPEGISGSQQLASLNSIADGGDEVFFTTNVSGANALQCASGSQQQLFVRLGDSRTLEVSRPVEPTLPFGGCGEGGAPGEVPGEVPCSGAAERPAAYFKGASADGSRVYYATLAPPANPGERPRSELYLATIGCPEGATGCAVAERRITSSVDVSEDRSPGSSPDVQGIVAVSEDGSRVYFVARGALVEGPNAEGRRPVEGADNLYVYDAASQKLSFVADLCSGPIASGGSETERAVEDKLCPSSLDAVELGRNDTRLWQAAPEAQVTPDGAVLVFSTYGRLTRDDTDNAKDVYRYDAVAGTLQRVSVGEDGAGLNGNCNEEGASTACDATIGQEDSGAFADENLANQAVSEDGSTIAFGTAQPLSSQVVNGHENVYEWIGGKVALVSSGSSPTSDGEAVVAGDGRDVFFATTQGLVRADYDGLPDIYDARVGGGFGEAPEPVERCEGDACQGPLTNPAPLLVPGTAVQAPEAYAAHAVIKKKTARRPHTRRVKHAPKRRRHAHR